MKKVRNVIALVVTVVGIVVILRKILQAGKDAVNMYASFVDDEPTGI